ncbi:MAG TPA: DUF3108 domain-containing protein [Gammaproteobacteria bacterium]|nr:DUF3108 domain-containing protein [Gammaproteobacteria bacterium]
MKRFPAWFRHGTHAIGAALLLLMPAAAGAGGEPVSRIPAPDTVVNETPAMKDPVSPYTAKYSVISSGATVAEAVYTLTRSGRGWEFRAHAKPSRMASLFISTEIDEYSRLETLGGALRPLQYRYEQAAGNAHDSKNLRVDYDWQAGSLNVSNGVTSRQLALKPDTYDPLSAQLAVIQCMKNNCANMDYRVLDEMELQQRIFERDGTETVQTALGDYSAVKISYHKGKRRTTLWLAPALQYIPVKIQQFKGKELKSEMRISAMTFE